MLTWINVDCHADGGSVVLTLILTFQPEVAKQWLRDREDREAAARGPDDRDRRRREACGKDSAAAAAAVQETEDKDVEEVTKKMAKLNK